MIKAAAPYASWSTRTISTSISPTLITSPASNPIMSLVNVSSSNGDGSKNTPLRLSEFTIIFVSFNVYKGIFGSK